jgi:L-serine deaminase
MSLILPPIVAAYFVADNRHDAAAVAACFTPEGMVTDEGHDYRGHAAISGWKRATTEKYAVTTAPLSLAENAAGGCTVRARVSGSFPGSPLDIDFAFSFERDQIASLRITA